MQNQPQDPLGLPEKDFIHEEYRKNPYPFWLWLVLLTIFAALMWGGRSWYQDFIIEKISSSPFTQVTNREFSLFLWQNPEHMRVNQKSKTGYLPAFQYLGQVGLDPQLADQYVLAPPDVIFLYHVWDRLLGPEFISRPISVDYFIRFLHDAEEWKPFFWPKAPKDYVALVNGLSERSPDENLDLLPQSTLPLEVRRAFIGWMNYFKEGDQINKVQPTLAELQKFLGSYPHYARNYWRNIVAESTPHYLESVDSGKGDPESKVPTNELSSFLKVAFFNYQKGQGEKKKDEKE